MTTVFGYAVSAVNLASALLANGMCCKYHADDHEDRKREQEVILRKTIRSDGENHRPAHIHRRKEGDRHTGKPQEDRGTRKMKARYERSAAAEGNIQANSIREFDRRQRPPPYWATSEQIDRKPLCHRYEGCSLGQIDQPIAALLHAETSHVCTETPLKVASLMVDSDDEDKQFEEICID